MQTLKIQNITVKYPESLRALKQSMIVGANTLKTYHNAKQEVVFVISETKNKDLIVTARPPRVLNYVIDLTKKTKPREIIDQEEFEHGFNGLFASAFEKLYRKWKFFQNVDLNEINYK